MKTKTENSKTKKSVNSKNKKSSEVAAAPVKEIPVDSTALQVPANDSLGVLDADTGDVVEPQLPTPEQLGISITAGNANGMLTATVGDTINFPVTVSWSAKGSAILVVPTSSANAKGILQLGVSQESSRSVKDGNEMAQITFNYKLVAQDTGNLNIPAMRFEIPMPTGQSLDLRSESVPLRVDAPFNAVPFIAGVVVGVCVLLTALWRMRRRSHERALAAKKSAFENALHKKMMLLKQRVMVADSREWLLELEGVCKEYAVHRFGGNVAAVNLETMVANEKLGDGWKPLLEEFAHARYGGGKRNNFENKETWKFAMRLMGVNEEQL